MHKVYYKGEFNGNIILPEAESKHALKVIRMKQGDQLLVLNGEGAKAKGRIDLINKKNCTINILEIENEERRANTHLTLAIAPTKNISRFEWFVEKATEIGVDRIVPVLCSRSERKHLKTERINKILISAMKQSGQLFLPQLDELTPIKSFIEDNPNGFMAYVDTDENTPQLSKAIEKHKKLTILIGPEGDFTPDEINLAANNGYTFVKLGPSVLRTETAGVYVCSIVNSK
ncbi:MAG: 16S rRNA (uracil(1498)-N(3))-methyltransferase [Crocinitomicaceae bacterium]|nr:16S rRNA (uracil(1498)-N(3))-methyltransferase [Crocinitomicaceae bacterium]|tara:strand:- start:2643 stop:3335 length:693 start_codon:yes stop_codon:yes gene_type:complete